MIELARKEYPAFDRGIIHEVWDQDCYRLPAQLTGTVIDIGAHIGAFTFLALKRGATRVLAYEADLSNYLALCRNLFTHCQEKNVSPCHAAVWRSDRTGLIPFGSFEDGNPDANTGGCTAAFKGEWPLVIPSIGLDRIVNEKISFLKIDAEGSEYPILLTASDATLLKVERIALEYHDKPLCAEAAVGNICDITGRLVALGFEVTVYPKWTTAGFLFAHRS